MSRSAELAELERAFAAGNVSAEVAQKRAAQLLGAFRNDWRTRGRCVFLWNAARAKVGDKQKAARKRGTGKGR
jgi:hypothetical protein